MDHVEYTISIKLEFHVILNCFSYVVNTTNNNIYIYIGTFQR